MICKYCQKEAIGINYKPRKQLSNDLTCKEHKTSLFIQFKSEPSYQKPTLHSNVIQRNPLQSIFVKLIDKLLAQLNLLKAQALDNYKSLQNLSEKHWEIYEMKCLKTNPYMIINCDEDLIVQTLLNQVKFKYQIEKVQKRRQEIYSIRVQGQTEKRSSQNNKQSGGTGLNLLRPKMVTSTILSQRSAYNSPRKISNQQETNASDIFVSKTEKRKFKEIDTILKTKLQSTPYRDKK